MGCRSSGLIFPSLEEFSTIYWATRKAQEYWSRQSILSPGELSDPGIEMGSPALQADSLPAELSGKPSNKV